MPFASAVFVGALASKLGKNGWKWAVLTFLFSFTTLTLAVTAGDKVLSEMLQLLPVISLLIILGLVTRVWRSSNRNISPEAPRRRLFFRISIVAIAAIAFSTPTLSELEMIYSVKSKYRLENAVQKEIFAKKKPGEFSREEAERVLDPEFLKNYGFDTSKYLDSKGFFSPNGKNWISWTKKTKIAAILFLADWHDFPTTLEIRSVLHDVDRYYEFNDQHVLLVTVVNASFRLSGN